MPDKQFEDASRRIDEIVEKLTNVITNTTITSREKEEMKKVLKRNLAHWQGFIRGEGDEDTAH